MPRSSLKTVLAQARELVDTLEGISVQLNSSTSQHLCRQARDLLHEGSDPPICFDLARPATLPPEARAALAAVLGNDVSPGALALAADPDAPEADEEDPRVRCFDLMTPAPSLIGQVRSPYLVLALDEATLDVPFLADELEALAEERARVVVVTLGDDLDVPSETLKRLEKVAWLVETCTLPLVSANETGAEETVENDPAESETADPDAARTDTDPDGAGSDDAESEDLEDKEPAAPAVLASYETPFWEDAHPIASAYALGHAFRRVVDAFERVVQQIKERQRVKKAEVDRQLVRLQEQAARFTRSSLAGDLNDLVKEHYDDFERGVGESYAQWTGRRTGELSSSVEHYINSLDTLAENELTQQVQLTIPERFTQGLGERLRAVLLERARRDVAALGDLHEMIEEDVEEAAREALDTSVALDLPAPNTRDYEHYLQNNVFFDTGFEKQVRKRGLYQKFMAARRPAMMLMMMSAAFGFALDAAGITRVQVGIAVAVLTVGGVAYAMRRAPVQDAEERDQALAQARQKLHREVHKIIEKATGYWLKQLHDYIAGLKRTAKTSLTEQVRQITETQGRQSEEEKRKKERLQSGIERMQRTLDDAERKNFIGDLMRTIDRLDREFLKLRPPAPRSERNGHSAARPASSAPSDAKAARAERRRRREARRK